MNYTAPVGAVFHLACGDIDFFAKKKYNDCKVWCFPMGTRFRGLRERTVKDMGLFNKGYCSAAQEELDRAVSELEAKAKEAQTSIDEEAANVKSNISFAERIGLINEEVAFHLRERVQRAIAEHKRFVREEYDIVNDYENHGERAKRFRALDSFQEEVRAALKQSQKEGAVQSAEEKVRD